MSVESIIHFDPFVSRVEAGFWHELAQRKLEKYKLSEAEQHIRGYYNNGKNPAESACILTFTPDDCC